MGIFGDFGAGFSENSKEIKEAFERLQLEDDYYVVKAWERGNTAEKRAATKVLRMRYPDEEQRRMVISEYK